MEASIPFCFDNCEKMQIFREQSASEVRGRGIKKPPNPFVFFCPIYFLTTPLTVTGETR